MAAVFWRMTGLRAGDQQRCCRDAHLLQAWGQGAGQALVARPQRLHLRAQLGALRLQVHHALQQRRPLVLHAGA